MPRKTDRGFTLMELMVATAITAVLVGLVVSALVSLARDRSSREAVIEVQGEARFGLGVLERDIRSGSLGAGTGVVTAGADTVSMVQVYDNVGGGFLSAKPGTDALLVVQALGAPRVAARGDHHGGTVLTVTDVNGFAVGDAVLFGEYGNAGWSRVTEIDPDTNKLTLATNIVRLGGLGAEEKLPSGSMVRPARARLYYVNTSDELVRVELDGPVPPATAAEVAGSSEVLALAFENFQVDVQLDPNAGAAGCSIAAPAEAVDALNAASGLLSTACVPSLRSLAVSAVAHSRRPLRDIPADRPISIGGVELDPAGANPGDEYVRRAYQLQVAVRNTSLGVL